MAQCDVLGDGAAEGGAQQVCGGQFERVQQGGEIVGEVAQRVGNRRVHGEPRVALVVGDRPDARAEMRPEGRELGAVALAAVDEHERHTGPAVDDSDLEITRSYGRPGRCGGLRPFPFLCLRPFLLLFTFLLRCHH